MASDVSRLYNIHKEILIHPDAALSSRERRKKSSVIFYYIYSFSNAEGIFDRLSKNK